MRKLEENQRLDSIFFWLLLLFMLFLMLRPVLSFSQGVPNALIRTRQVKVDAKSSDAVFVTERHFKVTESTVILDLNGKKIPLIDLPVPCLAKIKYALSMDQDPVVLMIAVKKIFPASRRAWFYEIRER